MKVEDYFKLCRELEDKHAIFLKAWEIGKPIFTKEIETAAIQFSPENGKSISYLFNPDFWDSLDDYNKLFVICHEMLHIILNHGIRSKDSDDKVLSNIALDIVVNHLLVNKFSFNRKWIKNEGDLCWIDTCFDFKVEENMNYEYYFKKLLENHKMPSKRLLDSHDGFSSKSFESVLKGINDSLKAGDKKEIKDVLDQSFKGGFEAGKSKGNFTYDFDILSKKKDKWESVIKKVNKNVISEIDKDIEQWVLTNRRFSGLKTDLIIPSEMEIEDRLNDKVEIWFYLDTSGSCYHYKDRFIKAALSLPKDKIKTRLFCFDTVVYDVNLKDKKLYGFGGTSFSIIEKHIQEKIKKEKIRYPKIVWLLTDGAGDDVNPEYPDRWYFFLSEIGKNRNIYTGCVPINSKIYLLRDYE